MMHMKSVHTKHEESFWMVDKNPSEDISPEDDTTAIFLVDNIALVRLNSVLVVISQLSAFITYII